MSDLPSYGAEARWAREEICSLVRSFPARSAGSSDEWGAQREIARRWGSWADEVQLQPFTVHPKAFMGFLPLAGALLLLAIPAYYFLPWLGLALALATLLSSALQFGLYRRFLDPFFPRADSCNVIAIKRPAGERKRVLLLGGHVDAAWEWRFHHIGGPLLVKAVMLGNGAALVVALVLHVVNVVSPGHWHEAGWVLFLCAPAWLCTFYYSDFDRVVPGAVDNLSGVFVGAALPRALAARGIGLHHTELRILSTGAEEVGLRGAKAYVAARREELAESECLFIALETFGSREELKIYDRDLNATIRSDEVSRELMRRATARAGLDLPFAAIVPGSSDAAAFRQAGLRAIAIAGMDHAPARFYHTRLDDLGSIDEPCMERAIAVAVEAARLFDEEGVDGLGGD